MIKHIIASMIIFFSLSYTMEEDEAKRAASQMKTSKNRSCLNQLFFAFTQFCQASGQESLYRNGYAQTLPTNILREIAHNPILVKENVLCYQTMADYDLEQLINFSRILCIRRPGLYFLTNNADQFAAAISGNAKNIPTHMQTIINGLKEKYGATCIISCAAPNGYFFHGTLSSESTHLLKNLKEWMQ